MSIPNSNESSLSGGKYVRKLEALEASVLEYKLKYEQLVTKVETFNRWKVSIQEWLFDNFAVGDPGLVERNITDTHRMHEEHNIPDSGCQLPTVSQVSSTSEKIEMMESSEVLDKINLITNKEKEKSGFPIALLKLNANKGTDKVVDSVDEPSVNSMLVKSNLTEANESKTVKSSEGIVEHVTAHSSTADASQSSGTNKAIKVTLLGSNTITESGNTIYSKICEKELDEILDSSTDSAGKCFNWLTTDTNPKRPKTSVISKSSDNSFQNPQPLNPNQLEEHEIIDVFESNRTTTDSRIGKKEKNIDFLNATMSDCNGVNPSDFLLTKHPSSSVQNIKNYGVEISSDKDKTPDPASMLTQDRETGGTGPGEQSSSMQIKGIPKLIKEEDDPTPCDVCGLKEPEVDNEMVFCEKCKVCVHQDCYGIQNIPVSDWLCNPCRDNLATKQLPCYFCTTLGGALKPVRYPAKKHWAHLSCTLGIREVKPESDKTMEPVINIKNIPASRWKLKYTLCKIKKGAPIQCSLKECSVAFHVTCARQYGLKIYGEIDDTLAEGCKMLAFCKPHSRTKAVVDKDVSTSGSPRKKRRVQSR